MKMKQSLYVFLITLLVWSFQVTSNHFQHHEIDKISECEICHTFGKLEHSQHKTPMVELNENIAIEIRREVKKVVVKERFDYKVVPQPKHVITIERRQNCMVFTSVGFDATAPPAYFS